MRAVAHAFLDAAPPTTAARCCHPGCAYDEAAELRRPAKLLVGADATRPARAHRWRPRVRARSCWRWRCGWSSRLVPHRGEPARVDAHPHGRLLRAADAHFRDAGHLRDALRDHRVRDVVDRARLHRVARSAPGSGSASRPGSPCGMSAASAGRRAGRRWRRSTRPARPAPRRRSSARGRTGCRCRSARASSTTRSP